MTLKEEFRTWQRALPGEITSDALWHSTAYRLGLFVADRSWPDLRRLAADPCTRDEASQLGRALRSISANYAEAFSRSSIADRCRIYEYSLGSSREARDRSFKVRGVIGAERADVYMTLLTRIIQLTTVTIVRERKRVKTKKPRRSE